MPIERNNRCNESFGNRRSKRSTTELCRFFVIEFNPIEQGVALIIGFRWSIVITHRGDGGLTAVVSIVVRVCLVRDVDADSVVDVESSIRLSPLVRPFSSTHGHSSAGLTSCIRTEYSWGRSPIRTRIFTMLLANLLHHVVRVRCSGLDHEREIPSISWSHPSLASLPVRIRRLDQPPIYECGLMAGL